MFSPSSWTPLYRKLVNRFQLGQEVCKESLSDSQGLASRSSLTWRTDGFNSMRSTLLRVLRSQARWKPRSTDQKARVRYPARTQVAARLIGCFLKDRQRQRQPEIDIYQGNPRRECRKTRHVLTMERCRIMKNLPCVSPTATQSCQKPSHPNGGACVGEKVKERGPHGS